MPIEQEFETVLKDIETSVVATWRKHPEMTDHAVLRVYEAAYAFYRSEQRGQPAKPHGLTGLDVVMFDSVFAICEGWLGRGKKAFSGPISAEDMVACLRRLTRSVKLNTQRAGRQGYLNFVGAFLK
jgi:hypothetical protein